MKTIAALLPLMLRMNIEKTHALSGSDGLKFVERYDINHAVSKWTIHYVIEINDFMTHSIELNNCKTKIKKICERLRDEPNCLYYDAFISTNERFVKREIDNIKSMTRRFRRSLTGILLKEAYDWIEQLLSDDGVDQDIIDQLQRVDKKNRDIVKHHISIMNSTLVINKQAFHTMIAHLEKLEGEIELVAKIQSKELLRIHLSNVIQYSNLILLQFYRLVSSFTRILNHDPTVNILDLIGDDIFLMNLKNIESKLGEKRSLPFTVSNETLFEFIRVGDVTITMSMDHINIVVTIPILDETTYKHYQIMPLPFKRNDSIYIHDSVANNIFVDMNDYSYALISNHDLDSCRLLDVGTLICPIRSPILFGPGCEIDSFRFNESEDCVSKKITNRNYIVRLNTNLFYIVPLIDTQVYIECENGTRETLLVNDTREVIIGNDCAFRTEDLEYSIEGEIVENVTISFSRNFSYSLRSEEDIHISTFNNTVFIEEVDSSFENITKRLLSLYEQANETPSHISVKRNSFHLLTTIIVAVMLYVVIRIGWKLLCQ